MSNIEITDHKEHKFDHWRMKDVKRRCREGDLEALAHAAMWNPNGGTADSQEFKSCHVAMDELLRLAKIGKGVEAMVKLLDVPDEDSNYPDYVQLGADDRGDWSIQRWVRLDPFDEDGPIGEGKTPYEALKDALEHIDVEI